MRLLVWGRFGCADGLSLARMRLSVWGRFGWVVWQGGTCPVLRSLAERCMACVLQFFKASALDITTSVQPGDADAMVYRHTMQIC